jgi:GNAT superfamily N-acetyltransferase
MQYLRRQANPAESKYVKRALIPSPAPPTLPRLHAGTVCDRNHRGKSRGRRLLRRLCNESEGGAREVHTAQIKSAVARKGKRVSLTFHPLTPERWRDLEMLFGERGACGGCWCMSWRLKRPQYERQKGPRNKMAFRKIVATGPAPGVLAYSGVTPVGWCAVAPRELHQRLENSRILARVDERPVWSVTCFFVARPFRRAGVSVQLLKAAVAHAANLGAKIVEGYPVEPRKDPMPDVFAWTGISSAFRMAGFKEVARRSSGRPIMRIEAC